MRVTPKNVSDIIHLVNRRVVVRIRDDKPTITGLVVKSNKNYHYYLLHNDRTFKEGSRPEDMRDYKYAWWLTYDDFGANDFEELISIDEDEKLGTIL